MSNTMQEPTTLKDLIELAAEKVGSQRKLAEALGQDEKSISSWKKGRACSLSFQATIAELAGVDPKEWVWRQVQEKRGKESATKSMLKRALHASALGVLAMLGTFGANDRAQAAAARGPSADNQYSTKRRGGNTPAGA